MLSVVWVKNSVFGLKQYARRKSERRLERENSVWQRTRTATRGLYKGEYNYGKNSQGKRKETQVWDGGWGKEMMPVAGCAPGGDDPGQRALTASSMLSVVWVKNSVFGLKQYARRKSERRLERENSVWQRTRTNTEKSRKPGGLGEADREAARQQRDWWRIVAWVTGNGMKEMPAKNQIQDEKLEVVGRRLQEPEILATLVGAETNGGGLRSGPAGMRTADPGRVKVNTVNNERRCQMSVNVKVGTNSEAVRRSSHALVGDNIVKSSGLCQLLERRKEGKKRRQWQDARLAEMTPAKGL
ncbi:hypothetical protein GGX14DRAFT_395312 [Mycena pura]|uniref:Uncharacterized protein n=1 Tax=Mycena pura TaxID=153505 RepID=A0AAD6VCM8_9AGAR|nr:hypothetical protein GGX14DRAFT_395312 [Mycena pura]